MAEEYRNLSPQTLVQMASGMTTMEIRLENLYVSITQVLNTCHKQHYNIQGESKKSVISKNLKLLYVIQF